MNNRSISHCCMIAYAVLIAGSFSFGALAIKFVDPILITTLRFIFASLLMGLIFIVSKKEMFKFPQSFWRYLILGNLMGGYFVLMFVALEFTDPVSTGAVFTLTPFLAMYSGYIILKQKPSYFQIISLTVSGAGAIWVIFKGSLNNILAFNIGSGELLFFIGCACQALYIPLVQKFNRGESVLFSTLWTLIGAMLSFCIYSIIVIDLEQIFYLQPVVWLCVLYLTIFATAISFFLLQFASLYLPPGKTISYAYLTPALICIIEGFLGHGWISTSILSGILLIISGLIYMLLTKD